MLTRDDIERNKREIALLLLKTKRKGIENVIQYIEDSGFLKRCRPFVVIITGRVA